MSNKIKLFLLISGQVIMLFIAGLILKLSLPFYAIAVIIMAILTGYTYLKVKMDG